MMRILAERNELEYGKDVKMLSVGQSIDLKHYLNAHPNETSYVVLFCAVDNWSERLTIETMGMN